MNHLKILSICFHLDGNKRVRNTFGFSYTVDIFFDNLDHYSWILLLFLLLGLVIVVIQTEDNTC